MFIIPGDRIQVARLFDFFLQGEVLAYDCALSQSEKFPDVTSRRFFKAQGRHEKFHAQVFRCGIGILAPKGIGRSSKNAAMESYRYLIESSLARNDLALSLLGMQIGLEGLGNVALKHISDGFGPRDIGFDRIRKMIEGQEDAHQAYGLQRFMMFFDSEAEIPETYHQHFEEYYHLLKDMMASVGMLFEHFNENPQQYLAEFNAKLPDFLRPTAT
jgi:hypothetical protein